MALKIKVGSTIQKSQTNFLSGAKAPLSPSILRKYTANMFPVRVCCTESTLFVEKEESRAQILFSVVLFSFLVNVLMAEFFLQFFFHFINS